MPSKIAIATIASGCLVITAFFLFRQKSNAPLSTTETKAAGSTIRQPDQMVAAAIPAATNLPDLAAPEVSSVNGSASNGIGVTQSPQTATVDAAKARQDEYVKRRISTLEDLAMDNDSSSLDTILSELTNADPQIRKAALEATIQFASRDAIPKLAEVAAQTEDPQEKIALNDAIEFLKLPSLTEVIAANKAAQPGQPVKPFVKAAQPLPPAARLPAPTSQ